MLPASVLDHRSRGTCTLVHAGSQQRHYWMEKGKTPTIPLFGFFLISPVKLQWQEVLEEKLQACKEQTSFYLQDQMSSPGIRPRLQKLPICLFNTHFHQNTLFKMHICIYTHKCKYIGEILPHFTFTLMPGFIPCNASSNQAWSYSCAHIIEKCQARTDYVLLTCAMLLSFMHCSICSKYMFKHMTVIPREFWFISNHVIIMGFIFQLDLF